jgi:hypothetical protein
MEPLDCSWCGSALSIEHGVCQVCLMRFPDDDDAERVVVSLDGRDVEVARVVRPADEAIRPAASE